MPRVFFFNCRNLVFLFLTFSVKKYFYLDGSFTFYDRIGEANIPNDLLQEYITLKLSESPLWVLGIRQEEEEELVLIEGSEFYFFNY